MIIINDIEELKKYKTKTDTSNGKEVALYEFKENGNFADVVFNVDIDFLSGKPIKVHMPKDEKYKEIQKKRFDIPVVFDLENTYLPEIEFSNNKEIYFIAKDIVANKKFNISIVCAENLVCKDECNISADIIVKHKLQGKSICCEYLKAKEIECEDLIVNEIFCGKLTAKIFCLKGVYIEDIKAKNINNYCYSDKEWHNGWLDPIVE